MEKYIWFFYTARSIKMCIGYYLCNCHRQIRTGIPRQIYSSIRVENPAYAWGITRIATNTRIKHEW
jgi:hypothetical protein